MRSPLGLGSRAIGFALLTVVSACVTTPVSFERTARLAAPLLENSERQIVVTIPDPGVTARTPAGSSTRPYSAPSGYGGSPYSQRVAARLARDYGLARIASWHIAELQVYCVVYEIGTLESRNALLQRLRADPRVESVQPMQRFRTTARMRSDDSMDTVSGAPASGAPANGGPAADYDDPYFRLQTGVQELHVPAAHRWSHGRKVRVAIIDTGVDVTHPELAGRIALARNFVDDDARQFGRDRHGTAVAGVVASISHNGFGIVGVAPGVDILAFKACWERPGAETAECNTLTLAAAIAAAIEHRAQVINLSLVGPADPLLRRLLERAMGRGITVVGAMAGGSAERESFPAAVPGVLAVADADEPLPKGIPLPIAAPGRHVLTLTPNGRFDYVSGVSLSAAMVSGVVALMLEGRALAPSEVADVIRRTASPSGVRGSARLVNACSAVATLIEGEAGCTASYVDAGHVQE